MDGANENGGNAETGREDSNLEDSGAMPEPQDIPSKPQVDADNTETQEVNGDLKEMSRKGTPYPRKKLRRFKGNSATTTENDASLDTNKRKRKFSEIDDINSSDSMDFNGFDSHGISEMEPRSHVLKKLIAEAEIAQAQLLKRFKCIERSFDGVDKKEDDPNFDDFRTYVYETNSFEMKRWKRDSDMYNAEYHFIGKVKKEKESDKSETDSVDILNSLDSELDLHKSTNSSVTSSPSQRSRGSRLSGISPGSLMKQKVANDMSNPLYKEPFKYGWKRELVFRGSNDPPFKKMADIYYYTPKGKKVRSFREVAESLTSKDLTVDNFTFFKEPIGLDDPEKEIIREAKKQGSIAESVKGRKSIGTKKAVSGRKLSLEEPPTPVVTSPVSTKAVARSTKSLGSPAYKTKTTAKKTPQIKIKPPIEESEMHPPQRNTPNTRRNQQLIEKITPVKTKRVLTPKVQEPCSIRCSTSMGLIPSLQCRVCLCLYHPECVDGKEFAGSDEYVCKNCQQDTKESHSSNNSSLTPPPLIPISMLGAQNVKPKHQPNLAPPKLQRIPKSDSVDIQTKSALKTSKISSATLNTSSNVDKKEVTWFTQTENEFLQSHDGTMPKPAQNIALMGGKRYIVVPKNNAMAVQPAITVKPDKIGDKSPLFQDGSLIDISNIVDDSNIKLRTSVNKQLNTDLSERLNVTSDKEISKDLTHLAEPTSFAVTDEMSETFDGRHSLEKDKSVGDVSENEFSTIVSENESSTINTDNMPESRKSRISHKSPESKSITPVYTANNTDDLKVNTETTKIDCQPLLSSKASTVKNKSNKRKQNQQEIEQQQHFMGSVCAGYHALLRIFQYLKVQELLRAARVCKMWHDLAAHSSLWKTVRMKNSQVTDWDGLADTLQRRGTQHLDLRKMLVAGESDGIWRKFLTVIPRVTSLVKLELCRCPVMVVEDVIKNCPQLEVLSAMTIKCDSLNLESVGNLKRCQELRLKAISGMSLEQDLTPLQELTQLTQLSLTSIKELGKKKIDIVQTLINLETLELGECSDFPDKFGTTVLIKLNKLERLRLEKGQGSCCTFDILEGVSKLENLSQMELVNFDVKNGFDKCLANCKNIKRLLIIPTYISQSATSNNMVLGGVTELSNNLTHFVWGVTLELLRVTELFVDQCNLMNKQVTGDSIPVLKPVPCLKLIEDVEDENENQKDDDKQQPHLTSPQVDILPLPQLQKLLLTALPKTRVKILKIPFHATWRQSISDTAAQ